MTDGEIVGAEYAQLLTEIKSAVAATRIRAARVINSTLVQMYWQIGQIILQRQSGEGWGTKVIDRLSVDLRTEFPGVAGAEHPQPGLHADLRRRLPGRNHAAQRCAMTDGAAFGSW